MIDNDVYIIINIKLNSKNVCTRIYEWGTFKIRSKSHLL